MHQSWLDLVVVEEAQPKGSSLVCRTDGRRKDKEPVEDDSAMQLSSRRGMFWSNGGLVHWDIERTEKTKALAFVALYSPFHLQIVPRDGGRRYRTMAFAAAGFDVENDAVVVVPWNVASSFCISRKKLNEIENVGMQKDATTMKRVVLFEVLSDGHDGGDDDVAILKLHIAATAVCIINPINARCL